MEPEIHSLPEIQSNPEFQRESLIGVAWRKLFGAAGGQSWLQALHRGAGPLPLLPPWGAALCKQRLIRAPWKENPSESELGAVF